MTEDSQQLAQMRRLVQICIALTGLNTLVILVFTFAVFQAQAKLTEINGRIQKVEMMVTTTIETTRESLGTLRQRVQQRWFSESQDPTSDPVVDGDPEATTLE